MDEMVDEDSGDFINRVDADIHNTTNPKQKKGISSRRGLNAKNKKSSNDRDFLE